MALAAAAAAAGPPPCLPGKSRQREKEGTTTLFLNVLDGRGNFTRARIAGRKAIIKRITSESRQGVRFFTIAPSLDRTSMFRMMVV